MEREIMLLSEAWERYQSDKKIEGYSPLTLKMYSFQYKLLKRYLGDIKIDEFTTEKLKQYLIESGGHLKPSSLGHRIRFIKSLFKSDRKSTRLNSSHVSISYAVFCLKKKNKSKNEKTD